MDTSADANNRLLGYGYDAGGNMNADGVNTYVYDGENRIASAAGATYTYDANGRRVKKSSGTNYWYGPSGALLAETDSAGTWTNYIFFAGQRLARNVNGDIKYYITDHLHSTGMFVDKNGTTILDDNDFYPWGGVVPGVGQTTSNNTIKFTGQHRDSESQLDYFGARYYANLTGRFMTPDWDGGPTTVPYADFGDPQSLNLYSYVRNSPIMRVDADGHFDDPFGTFGTNAHGGDNTLSNIQTPGERLGARRRAAYWDLQQLSIETSASMATEQGNVPTSNTPTGQNNPGVYVCPSRACRFGAWWGKTKADFNDFLCRHYVTCSMIPGAIAADPFVNPSGQWPAFVPSDWDVKDTKKMNGKIYVDPKNEHNRIRVMDEGYVKIQKNGRYFDVHGREVLGDSAEAHIPINKVLQELIDSIFAIK